MSSKNSLGDCGRSDSGTALSRSRSSPSPDDHRVHQRREHRGQQDHDPQEVLGVARRAHARVYPRPGPECSRRSIGCWARRNRRDSNDPDAQQGKRGRVGHDRPHCQRSSRRPIALALRKWMISRQFPRRYRGRYGPNPASPIKAGTFHSTRRDGTQLRPLAVPVAPPGQAGGRSMDDQRVFRVLGTGCGAYHSVRGDLVGAVGSAWAQLLPACTFPGPSSCSSFGGGRCPRWTAAATRFEIDSRGIRFFRERRYQPSGLPVGRALDKVSPWWIADELLHRRGPGSGHLPLSLILGGSPPGFPRRRSKRRLPWHARGGRE